MKKETLERLMDAVKDCLAEIKTSEKVRPCYGDTVDLNKLLRDPDYALSVFEGATFEIIGEYGEVYVVFRYVNLCKSDGALVNRTPIKSPVINTRTSFNATPMLIKASKDKEHLWTGRFNGNFSSALLIGTDVILGKGEFSIKFQ